MMSRHQRYHGGSVAWWHLKAVAEITRKWWCRGPQKIQYVGDVRPHAACTSLSNRGNLPASDWFIRALHMTTAWPFMGRLVGATSGRQTRTSKTRPAATERVEA